MTAPRKLREIRQAFLLALLMVAMPQLVSLPSVIAYGVPVNLGGFLIDSSILELTIGLVLIGGAVAARMTKNAQGQRAPMIGSGIAVILVMTGGFFVLIGVFTFTPLTTAPPPPPPGMNALSALIAPSVDTTASLPGSPYTACTSLTLGKIGATGSAAGVVWTTGDASYQANSGSSASGGTFTEVDSLARTKSGSTFNTATCFQMAFTWQYTPSPINTVGQTFKAPVMAMITGISYTVLSYNNATLINYPVVAQQPLVNGRQDWSILFLTGAGSWIPACPGAAGPSGQLSASQCTPQQVDLNDGTTTDTIKLSVIVNVNGPFGYDQAYSPKNKVWSISFAIGLPQGSSGAQNNYMNWVPYTLNVLANG